MKVEVNKLRCDNPKCDNEYEVKVGEQLEELIDVPCPKCGELILTIGDWENLQALKLAGEINGRLGFGKSKLVAEALLLLYDAQEKANIVSEASDGNKALSVEFNTHGTNSIKEYKIVDVIQK